MADGPAGLRITPKVIEIGDEIISVANISRVSIGRDPERTRRAALLMAAGIVVAALTIGAVANNQIGLGLILGLAASVAILVSIGLRNGEALFIGTSEGKTTIVMQKQGDFMRRVFDLLRAAMEEEHGGQVVYQVNVQAEWIDRLDASASTHASAGMVASAGTGGSEWTGRAGATVAGRDVNTGASPTLRDAGAGQGAGADAGTEPVPSYGARPGEPGVPDAGGKSAIGSESAGRGEPLGLNPRDWFVRSPKARQVPADHDPQTQPSTPSGQRAEPASLQSVNVGYATDAIAIGRDANDARLETHARLETVAAFDAMMSDIAPQYGDRFDDVRQWLDPVRAYLDTRQGNLAEAQSRWSIFAKEHLPAFANIATVSGTATKIARGLGLAQ